MATKNKTQLLVIGAGPGGYTAAFHAADLGLNVTLIDNKMNPGGVCLFTGCIPSKTLLHAAKVIKEIKEAKDYGIETGEITINVKKLVARKNTVVKQLTGGLGMLTKKRGINYIQGLANFKSSQEVSVTKVDGTEETITFEKAIIATGSHPVAIPNIPTSSRIINSSKAFHIQKIPSSLLVIGGGYIGLELGSVYAQLGSEVSIVEMEDSLLSGIDDDLTRVLSRKLRNLFKEIHLSTKVTKVEETPEGILVTLEDKKGTHTQTFDKVLISVGRKPSTKDIGLDSTQIAIDESGFIVVNEKMQTTENNIYAIGDVVGNPMLAHKASHEGFCAAKNIAGEDSSFAPKSIPAVIFTDPEIAVCGLSESDAQSQNIDIKIAKFPWAASGRALTLNRTEGITKLIVDPKTEKILGAGIVGINAGELIAEVVLAIELEATVSDLKNCIHPHPTLSETVMESAEDFFGLSPHLYKPKK